MPYDRVVALIGSVKSRRAPLGRMMKIVGVGAGVVSTVFGLYLFNHDCLILAHIVPAYGDGPAGMIVGPALVLIGVVSVLAFLERPLFPS